MSVNGSGEFNNFLLSRGSNQPTVPQNTPACSSFSDRMQVQMNLKNIKGGEAISLSEKDAVVKNLSSRLMSLSSTAMDNEDDNEKILTRREALLELQRTRLGYLITHLERINLIESEKEAEMSAIIALQEKLIAGGHVDFGVSGPRVEDGAIPDFWPTVLTHVTIPCVGETELRLFDFVTNVTSEYLPADIEGLKSFLAKTYNGGEEGGFEWPTCDGIPGNMGSGLRITFHLRHNNIITCPGNRLSIELRYDIEIASTVAHVACSNFTRIDGSSSAFTGDNQCDPADFNLLDLMEVFAKGLDVSSIDEESNMAEFYQDCTTQISEFCESINTRVIPYASQLYFGAIDNEDKE